MPKPKLTTERFITRSIIIHNDKYDYSKSEYLDYHTKITITCSSHGDFIQLPNNHLKGSGCRKCAKEKLSNLFMSSAEKFVISANTVHDYLYDYSKVVYNGNKNKVEIICDIHGSFYQKPANHITGYGCPHCGKSFPLNTQSFIEKANDRHNNRYNYELVDYKSNHVKIIIICREHGQFSQEPAAHLSGAGCPNCGINISKPETKWLDHLLINDDYRHKIIMIGDKRFWVDAYDPINNIVYEFNGDFWHGNPSKFKSEDVNPRSKKTFGELYLATLSKEKMLIEAGYNVISMWESDWKQK